MRSLRSCSIMDIHPLTRNALLYSSTISHRHHQKFGIATFVVSRGFNVARMTPTGVEWALTTQSLSL